MKNRIKFSAMALMMIALLAGCSGEGSDGSPVGNNPGLPSDTSSFVFTQELPDGREVLCVYADGFKAGGLSCDWANAK